MNELRQFLIGRLPRLTLALDSISERALPTGWPEPDPYAPHGDADFKESEHDRDEDGKFTEGGGKVRTGHAKKGGEIAQTNKAFYKGGQFLPSTEAPPGTYKVKGTRTILGKGREMFEPGKWETAPTPLHRAIYPGIANYMRPSGSGREYLDVPYAKREEAKKRGAQFDWDKKKWYMEKEGSKDQYELKPGISVETSRGGREPITRETDMTMGVKGYRSTEKSTLGDLIDRYNKGERWVEVKLPADVQVLMGKNSGGTAKDAQFREQDVKRDEGGKFTSTGGGGSSKLTEGKSEPEAKKSPAPTVSSRKSFTPPERTVTGYKLFETKPNRPGELFPLFIDKKQGIKVGQWVPAVFSPTKGFAARPGWHAGDIPSAWWLRQTSTGKRNESRVWAEVELPDDTDWQKEANKHTRKDKEGVEKPLSGDLPNTVPEGGHYRFIPPGKEKAGLGGKPVEWMIGGALRVKRVLPDSEVHEILTKAGDLEGAKAETHMKHAQDIAMDGLKQFLTGRLNHLSMALDAVPACGWRSPPFPTLALDFEKGDFKESDVKRDEGGKFAEQAGAAAAEPQEGPKAEEPPTPAAPKKAPQAARAAAAAERKAAEAARKTAAAAERKAASERRAAAARGHPQAYVSPNESNLTMTDAERELSGKRQKLWQTLSTAIDARLGFSRPKSEGAIGVWEDGAENTLIVEYSKNADYELVKAATAMKAAIGNQKAALIFQPSAEGHGPEAMASFEAKGSLKEISQKLVNEGLLFHTLEPISGGARVHIFVEDQKTADAVVRAAGDPRAIESVPGHGEFIGNKLKDGTDDAQRADAQRDYKEIIDSVAAGRKDPDIQGIWGDTNNHWRSATGADNGVGLKGSQGHPALISSRRPTAAGALESDRYRQVNLDALKEDPAIFKATMDAFKNPKAYPNFRPGTFDGKTPDQIAEIVTDHIVDNLVFLHNNADDEVKKHGPQWYEGAHSLAKAKSDKYNLPIQSTSGVYAALSPQKDWDQNVYLGDHLIDIYQTKQDYAWDDDMTAKGKEIWAKEEDEDDETTSEQKKKNKQKIRDAVLRVTGKKLSELTNSVDKAIWIRTYDEAHSDRHFDNMSPDGKRIGTAMNKKKNPDDPDVPATAAWQSTPSISNAIQALESDGDRDTISRAMGNKNKVRCFYNNILDPDSDNDDVTMDTHAVGAAFLSPMTGKSQAVMHNLTTTPQGKKDIARARAENWKAPPTATALGLGGTYGLIADAYRKAAKKLKLPRARILQSVTWEAKRRLMPDDMTDARKNELESVWQDYRDGKIEHHAAQSKVLEIAHRKDEPVKKAPKKKEPASGAKRAPSPAVDARPRDPSDAGQLHLRQLGLQSPGAMDSRTRNGPAARPAGHDQGRDRVGCGWTVPSFSPTLLHEHQSRGCGWSSPRFPAQHLAFDAFVPQHAPAGSAKGGQFVAHGGGGGGEPIHVRSAAWTGRENRLTPGQAPGGLGTTATKAAEAAKRWSSEDYEVLKKTLPSRQKTWGQNLSGLARTLPQLMKTHGKEEVQKAKHAAGALGSLARGRQPTPEQTRGLRQFGISLMMSVGMFAATGDPTGTIAHGASYLATHLAQEFAQHAVLEHTAKLMAGAGRYAYHAATGGGDAAMGALSPDEMKLLQDFVTTLAKVVATHKIPDDRLAQLMGQTKAA